MEKRFEPSATHGGNKSCELSTYPNYFLARIDSVEKIPRNARRTNHCARNLPCNGCDRVRIAASCDSACQNSGKRFRGKVLHKIQGKMHGVCDIAACPKPRCSLFRDHV